MNHVKRDESGIMNYGKTGSGFKVKKVKKRNLKLKVIKL